MSAIAITSMRSPSPRMAGMWRRGAWIRRCGVYELATGQLVKSFAGHNDPVTNVAFSADSRQVFSSGDSVIHVWDLATGKELPRRFEGHSGRMSGHGDFAGRPALLTGGDDRTVKLWEAASGKMLHSFAGHSDTIGLRRLQPRRPPREFGRLRQDGARLEPAGAVKIPLSLGTRALKIRPSPSASEVLPSLARRFGL